MISLKCIPKGLIHKVTALVQIMAWCRQGDKPLSQPMMVRLLMHICVNEFTKKSTGIYDYDNTVPHA